MAQLFLGKVPLLAAEPHEIAESLVQSIQITVLHYCIMPLPAPRCQFRKVLAKRANGNAVADSQVQQESAGESFAISGPRGETSVLKHFQARMPYGLVVPDVDTLPSYRNSCLRLILW
jgi:hypothetical protein